MLLHTTSEGGIACLATRVEYIMAERLTGCSPALHRTHDFVQKCKGVLSRTYGSQLKGVILYGSAARGEADLASVSALTCRMQNWIEIGTETGGVTTVPKAQRVGWKDFMPLS